MGFFSRRTSSGSSLPLITPDLRARLGEVGRTKYLAHRYVDASPFYLPAFLAAGPPEPGPETQRFAERLYSELNRASAELGGWAAAGAFYVAMDFDVPAEPASGDFGQLMDRALTFMAGAGVGGLDIPMFAMSRWSEIRQGTV